MTEIIAAVIGILFGFWLRGRIKRTKAEDIIQTPGPYYVARGINVWCVNDRREDYQSFDRPKYFFFRNAAKRVERMNTLYQRRKQLAAEEKYLDEDRAEMAGA